MDPGLSGAGHSWKTITAGKEVAHDHEPISIKFGIPIDKILDAYKQALELGFYPIGLHEHIGSNWRTDEEVNEFLQTVDIALEKAGQITELLGRDLDFVDFGGGPGIRYKDEHQEFPLEKYAEGVFERIKKSDLKFKTVAFEPGRYIVGDAGILLVEVNTIKMRYGDLIVGTNGGFHVLVRPAMYGSHHEIIHCSKADQPPEEVYTVVGNLCETGDVLSQDPSKRPMPRIRKGDILAIHNGGAYGYSMSTPNYNSRGGPIEIIVGGGRVIKTYIPDKLAA